MTTPPISDRDDDALRAEVVELVVTLMSGAATTADAAKIRAWRARGPEQEAAFSEAVRTWRGLRHAARTASSGAQARNPSSQSAGRLYGRRALLIGGASAAAAAAAAVAVLNPPLELWPSLSEMTADYRTAKGERRTVSLVPNVSLELNTLTSLAVTSTTHDPGVELIAGEALIESRLGSSRRLSVAAAGGSVTASDARFNILCSSGGATVTCLEGAVEVRHGGETVRLGPNQRVAYARDGLAKTQGVDVKRETAWADGLLVFMDRPLQSVVTEVNRYRQGRIVIVNADLGRRIVNGTFRIDRLDNFVAQVEQLFGARATALPGGLTMLS